MFLTYDFLEAEAPQISCLREAEPPQQLKKNREVVQAISKRNSKEMRQ
jgi:hypothetical protein